MNSGLLCGAPVFLGRNADDGFENPTEIKGIIKTDKQCRFGHTGRRGPQNGLSMGNPNPVAVFHRTDAGPFTEHRFENTMRRVVEMGYTNVQTRAPEFMNDQELAVMLSGFGLQADSAFCSVYDIPEKVAEIVAGADALKTDVLRTDSIRNEDRSSRAGDESFARHLNKCGKALYEVGLKFMYHFHSFEFIQLEATRGIDILLNQTDPEYVMFQPDVFWLTAASTEPSESLKMFAGRAKYVHLKDYLVVSNKTAVLEETRRVSAPVGNGNLNWQGIFKTAKEIGIENFVVEDDMGILDPFDSAKQSIENMKKFGF